MRTPLIEFRKVSKRFGDKVVLDGVDMTIYPGEVTTLIGRSGEGKSVTLKMIIGLLKPDSGDILYRGRSVSRMKRAERERFRREVSFMFQSNALFDSMTVRENIALPLQEGSRASGSTIRDRVDRKLQVLDLEGTEDKYPSQLSGGMQKRVALARAIVTDPDTVLFDEPTTGLDPVRKNSVLSMITSNQRDYGFTAVLVSHDVPDVFYISNRIVVLEEGRILYQGAPQDLEQREDPVLQEYVNSQEILRNEIYGLQSARWLERAFSRLLEDPDRGDAVLILISLPEFHLIKEQVGHLMGEMILGSIARIFYRVSQHGDSCQVARYLEDRLVCLCYPGAENMDPDKLLQGVAQEFANMNFCSAGMRERQAVFSVRGGWDWIDDERSLASLVNGIEQQKKLLGSVTCSGGL
ncbi:MAG: ATP-binding cassette domain-containing protein [Desulfohalobiaceae bacterium]|nr:ATP-binding cassette domain-containing protein [Desulfohalobiaceae bacterium]